MTHQAHVDADTGELTLVYGRFDRPHSPHSRIYSVVTAASTGAPWVPQGDLPASLYANLKLRHGFRATFSAYFSSTPPHTPPLMRAAWDSLTARRRSTSLETDDA